MDKSLPQLGINTINYNSDWSSWAIILNNYELCITPKWRFITIKNPFDKFALKLFKDGTNISPVISVPYGMAKNSFSEDAEKGGEKPNHSPHIQKYDDAPAPRFVQYRIYGKKDPCKIL